MGNDTVARVATVAMKNNWRGRLQPSPPLLSRYREGQIDRRSAVAGRAHDSLLVHGHDSRRTGDQREGESGDSEKLFHGRSLLEIDF